MISIVIPAYNEERVLQERAAYFQKLAQISDLIFVDGGSGDQTSTLASRYGRVIQAPKGRAAQMNEGAQHAKTSTLLFLHVDTRIEGSSLNKIETALAHGYLGGCFRQVIEAPGLLFKWIAFTGNLRARFSKVFYGDQGIFVRKDSFEQLGGFPEVDLAEDILFAKQLRCLGRVVVLSDLIYCSARRWQRQGIVKTFFLNQRIGFNVMTKTNLKRTAKLYQDVR